MQEEKPTIQVPKSVLNYAQVKANKESQPIYAVAYKEDVVNNSFTLFTTITEAELKAQNKENILFISEPVYPQNAILKLFDKIFG